MTTMKLNFREPDEPYRSFGRIIHRAAISATENYQIDESEHFPAGKRVAEPCWRVSRDGRAIGSAPTLTGAKHLAQQHFERSLTRAPPQIVSEP
jgi:hypothetical protein